MRFGEEFHFMKKNRPKGRPPSQLDACSGGTGTIRLTDGSRDDVQAKIDASIDGDCVIIPNGIHTWTQGIGISGKRITLTGETEGGVTIVDDLPGGTNVTIISVSEATSGHARVKNLKFDSRNSSGRGGGTTNFHISILGATSGRAILCHNNTHLFSDGGGTNAYQSNVNRGVLYNNTATAIMPGAPQYLTTASFLRLKLDEANGFTGPFGMYGWNDPSTMGTLDTTGEMNFYVENNTMNFMMEGTDFDDACRVVFRYNTLNDSNARSHGFDSSPIGSRQVEVYNNDFNWGQTHPVTGITMNIQMLLELRGGGVWYVHNNEFTNASSSDWGGNIPDIKIILYGARVHQCFTSYPAPRQHGRGHNGTSEISSPIHFWNNYRPGGVPADNIQEVSLGDYNGDPCGNGMSTSFFVQENRDYFVGTAPSGYTTYSYPHPLRSL